MDQKIVFPTGDIYIGIKEGGDANTNQILYPALEGARLSDVCEWKTYKGNPVDLWKVTPKFIRSLYRERHDFMLLFDVYIEKDFTLQLFSLLDSRIKKKAKQKREKLLKKMKKIKERRNKEAC